MVSNISYDSNKPFRMLALFEKLCEGEVVRKKEIASQYGVSEKTIQRDIEDLRIYFSEAHISDKPLNLVYSPIKKGYVLEKANSNWLLPEEILALSRIILESRAFPKPELQELLNKLIIQGQLEHRKHIRQIIANESYHYISVNHGRSIFKSLWDLSIAIRKQLLITIKYLGIGSQDIVERDLQPVGVVFSEYYFYLIAYICDRDYEFPTIFRLDRIQGYQVKNEHFHVPYTERFEEGEFRKRVQFMQTGELIKIKFKYWGKSLEAILDRLPTAKLIGQDENNKHILEAEIFGQGIKMWFLSQGNFLEVLEPKGFRQELKETVKKMNSIYEE